MSSREQLHAYIARLEQRLRWSTLLRGLAILTGDALVTTLVLVSGILATRSGIGLLEFKRWPEP